MTTRIIRASRRFPKDYLEFLDKYADLDEKLREFLDFRQSHLPLESFGAMDGRVTVNTKLRRCHLVHGKAILIYQLYGSEIRLIALADHNVLEHSLKLIINYHKSIQPDDYYTFNVDEPVPAKPKFTPTLVQDPEVAEQPEVTEPEVIEPEVPEVLEPTAEQPPPATNGTANPLWDDKLVRFLEDQQMLYVPRPSRPVIPFILDREVIAPRGDVLIFDPIARTVHHLSRAEFEAGFQPHPRHTTDVGEAFSIAMQPVATPTDTTVSVAPAPVDIPVTTPTDIPTIAAAPVTPEPEPEPQPNPQVMPIRRPARKNDISAQTGRLLAVIAHLQQTALTNKIDSRSMKKLLEERDAMAASTTLFHAQEQGLVKKTGQRTGTSGFYYCLTPKGEKQAKLLADWPFTAVGLTPPFKKHQNATVAA